jgi:hypothetical protein
MKKFRLSHPALAYVEGHENDAEWVDDDTILVEGEMVVCPTCQGTGSHVRHDLDDSAMVDSMREDGDEEGLEAYFNGAFDERCTECNGNNVVLAPRNVPEWAAKAMRRWDDQKEYDRAIQEAERRMGA